MNAFRIAIAGLGTVGAGTVRLLQNNAALIAAHAGRPVEIVAVIARNRSSKRDCDLSAIRWIDDHRQLAAMTEADAVVELIGGAEGAAREICETALRHGKSVVTANKALLAHHGAALAQQAEAANAGLYFEAAVAGGIPVIKTLREGLAGNNLRTVQGILNGTCNYILTRMRDAQLDFDTALREAQHKGYAEADPGTDIDGHDTAHKLAVLAALAFGAKPDLDAVAVEGIRRLSQLDLQFAAELKYGIKLLGVARLGDRGLEQRVGPCLVPLASPLANTDDVLNAVLLRGDAAGDITLIGRGAGANPTASAVVADIVDLARGQKTSPFGIPAATLRQAMPAPAEARISGWYMRLQVKDRPGVVADIAAVLRDEAISIKSLLQHGRSSTDSVPVVIVTHEIDEAALRRAAAKIGKLAAIAEPPCLLRIESTEQT